MPTSSGYHISFYSMEVGAPIILADPETMLSDEHMQIDNERNIAITDLVESQSPHVKDAGNVLQTLSFTTIHRYGNIEDFQSDTIHANDTLSKIKTGLICITTLGGEAKRWHAVCQLAKAKTDIKKLKIEISYEFVLNPR